jgi:hypothetical protein
VLLLQFKFLTFQPQSEVSGDLVHKDTRSVFLYVEKFVNLDNYVFHKCDHS